jgi:hypothetical protein
MDVRCQGRCTSPTKRGRCRFLILPPSRFCA